MNEKYIPTEREFVQAEEVMTDEQRELSEERCRDFHDRVFTKKRKKSKPNAYQSRRSREIYEAHPFPDLLKADWKYSQGKMSEEDLNKMYVDALEEIYSEQNREEFLSQLEIGEQETLGRIERKALSDGPMDNIVPALLSKDLGQKFDPDILGDARMLIDNLY